MTDPFIQQQVGNNSTQFWPGIPQSPDLLLVNLDQNDNITVGPPNVQPNDINGYVIPPQDAISLNGDQEWWCVTDSAQAPLTLQVLPGGGNWSAGALAIAGQIAASGLALAIAEEIASQGLTLVAAPTLLYDIGAVTTATGNGLFGATVFPGANETPDSCITKWNKNVGRKIQVCKRYFSVDEGMPLWSQLSSGKKASFQACIDENVQCWVCYNPANNPATVADGNAMVASLNSLVAQGVPVRGVVFWQENWQFGHGPNLPSGATAANFIAGYQLYYPILHAAGYKVMVDFGGQEPGQIPAWDPGAAFYDVVGVDYYFGNFGAGKLIDTTVAIASAGNKPLAVPEMGNSSVAGSQGPPQATVINAIKYLTGVARDFLAGGGTLDIWAWYQNDAGSGPNQILTPTDYRIPALQALADVVTSAPGGTGVTITAGSTVTMVPVAPSQAAGFAVAQGISYDITLSLTTSAGSTNPFATVEIDFLNSDDINAQPVRTIDFSMPCGTAGTGGTITVGDGPQRGQFMAIKITNRDSVSIVVGLQVNSTSRPVAIHDWEWDSSSSVAVPGFTASAGGGPHSNQVGAINGASVVNGTPLVRLFGMRAGEAFLRLSGEGGGHLQYQINPYPQGVMGSAALVNESPVNEFEEYIILPRSPIVVTVTNSDAGAAHNANVQIIHKD